MTEEQASAAEQLAEIERTRKAVSARAAKEHVPYFGWGLYALLMFPPFDVLDPDLWGPIMGIVATVIGIATVVYFYRRTRRIRVADRYPGWIWPLWVVYSNGLLLGALLLHSRVPFSATLAGLLAGVPMLVIGAGLRKRWAA